MPAGQRREDDPSLAHVDDLAARLAGTAPLYADQRVDLVLVLRRRDRAGCRLGVTVDGGSAARTARNGRQRMHYPEADGSTVQTRRRPDTGVAMSSRMRALALGVAPGRPPRQKLSAALWLALWMKQMNAY